jgi:cyclopropane fatty-acyl-phospholipid synthase-like methyltransferase
MRDYRECTMHRLRIDVGLRPGMRVLDLGCGRGLVARMVRELVCDRGEVLAAAVFHRVLVPR